MNRIALKTTIIYLTIGVLWIVFSALVLEEFHIFSNVPENVIKKIEIIKGLIYVFVTGGLLFTYIQINIQRQQRKEAAALAIQQQLNEQIAYQQQNLRTLLDSSRDSIWSVDRDLRLLSANAAFREAFGQVFRRPPVEGEILSGTLSPDLQTRWQTYYAQVLAGKTLEVTEEIKVSEQVIRYFSILLYPIFDANGKSVGISCFGHDITERENHLRKIRQQNEQLLKVAWIQSHKLRVPVAQILGLVSIFRSKELNSPVNVTIIQKLREVAENLDKIVHEVVENTIEIENSDKKNEI